MIHMNALVSWLAHASAAWFLLSRAVSVEELSLDSIEVRAFVLYMLYIYIYIYIYNIYIYIYNIYIYICIHIYIYIYIFIYDTRKCSYYRPLTRQLNETG
jgi:hypothetical protein